MLFRTLLLLATLLSCAVAASSKVRLLGSESRNEASGTASASVGALRIGAPTSTSRMRFLLSTLQQFKDAAEKNKAALDTRHAEEEKRLLDAIAQTQDPSVKAALQQSASSNQISLAETRRTYENILKFSASMSSLLEAANSAGTACEPSTCGYHASCTDTTKGAQCVCNEGFIGNGHDCHAPPEFKAHHLLTESPTAADTTFAKDMHVCVFEQNKIAVVYRDAARGNTGHLVVGKIREAGKADFSPPDLFTTPSGPAFHPVVQGTSDKRLLVAWRDQDTDGTAWVRGMLLGAPGSKIADMALKKGPAVAIATNQAHKMALVQLNGNRFALMYADKTPATTNTPAQPFGNSLLLEVDQNGQVGSLGSFRFSDVAVARLEITKLSPTSFILAARAAKLVDDLDPSITTNQEALAIYGEVVQDDIVFDPNPINLEPQKANIWARGVSLIAPNTFAYAYQEGVSNLLKIGVVEMNPSTHRMHILQEPKVIRSGLSPYINMLNVPYTASDPHTLAYYELDNASMVNVCAWSEITKSLDHCEDFPWLNSGLSSVSGVHLGGGKSFMVFSSLEGVPYYSVFGLSKK